LPPRARDPGDHRLQAARHPGRGRGDPGRGRERGARHLAGAQPGHHPGPLEGGRPPAPLRHHSGFPRLLRPQGSERAAAARGAACAGGRTRARAARHDGARGGLAGGLRSGGERSRLGRGPVASRDRAARARREGTRGRARWGRARRRWAAPGGRDRAAGRGAGTRSGRRPGGHLRARPRSLLSVRLNKLLAQRGLGARRKCDALIQSGVVRVNGVLVTEPGTQVEPGRDRVLVRGRPLPEPAAPRYYALHKPVGVITTLHDPEGRRTVRELLPPGRRLFPIGRLDADTSGLLLLTDDGDLAHHLMHPRYGVEKVYRAWIDRLPDPHQLARLRRGVEFEPGVVSAPARVRVPRPGATDPLLEIALHEGRYRQVRRMCEAVGLGVLRLHPSAYGPLHLGPLERGMCRELSDEEVKLLKAAVARPQSRPRGARQRSYTSGRARRSRPRGEGTPASEALATGPGRREPRGMPSRRELGPVTPD